MSQSKLQGYVDIAKSMTNVATFLAGITITAIYTIPPDGPPDNPTQCTYGCKLVSAALSNAFMFFVINLLCAILIQMTLQPMIAGEVDRVVSVQRWNKIAHNIISIHTFSLNTGILLLGLGLIGFGQPIVGGLVMTIGVIMFICYFGLIMRKMI